jgi:nucleoside-diphosphate-sugar epimerase
MKKILVTGSSGLIGSEVCLHFADEGWQIHGVDNNQRAVFPVPKEIRDGINDALSAPSRTLPSMSWTSATAPG